MLWPLQAVTCWVGRKTVDRHPEVGFMLHLSWDVEEKFRV